MYTLPYKLSEYNKTVCKEKEKKREKDKGRKNFQSTLKWK